MNTNGHEYRWMSSFGATTSWDAHPGGVLPMVRWGGSIEKDHPFNIDAQDAQDNQDGTLLRGLQSIKCKPLIIIELLWISPLQSPHFIPLSAGESIGPWKTFLDDCSVKPWLSARNDIVSAAISSRWVAVGLEPAVAAARLPADRTTADDRQPHRRDNGRTRRTGLKRHRPAARHPAPGIVSTEDRRRRGRPTQASFPPDLDTATACRLLFQSPDAAKAREEPKGAASHELDPSGIASLPQIASRLLKWLRETVVIVGPEPTISSISRKRGHSS